jgi:hypothetical protein
MDYQMDRNLKEIQRKTNMSLEDIIKERKKGKPRRTRSLTSNKKLSTQLGGKSDMTSSQAAPPPSSSSSAKVGNVYDDY